MRESSSVAVQQVTKCWDMCHVCAQPKTTTRIPYGRTYVSAPTFINTASLRFHHPFQLAAQGIDPLAGLVDMAVDRLVAFNAIRDQLEGGLSAGFGQTSLDHHVQAGPFAWSDAHNHQTGYALCFLNF